MITNTISKEIKYDIKIDQLFVENKIFSNNITDKHILYLYRFIISGCPELSFVNFTYAESKNGLD